MYRNFMQVNYRSSNSNLFCEVLILVCLNDLPSWRFDLGKLAKCDCEEWELCHSLYQALILINKRH